MYLGIDTGGTFTDFVLWDAGKLRVHKVLSTPAAPEQAILQGIHELGLKYDGLRVVHGSTVATNAVLEGKGVRTAFISNRGFADLLTIGRQNRRQLYALQPPMEAPPVPAELCLQAAGRLAADGTLVEPLTEKSLIEIQAALQELQPEAVAVNLLFSYLDDSHEQAISDVIPDHMFVSLSSRVLPEIKEYERGISTWLNAWVGPLVQGYLQRLTHALPLASVGVMQSSGDTLAADQAGEQAVHMLLSGPAGGLVAARFVAQFADVSEILTFDMGGTSTDVALLDGKPRLTNEGSIGRYPVAVPMVDMHTIGAGGGSIAWLDDGGMLQVGPESAGAAPGPACYGKGGQQATVTDANLLLGRLQADAFLGGDMLLDTAAARRVIQPLADAMQCDLETAALGIVNVANEHMARALRTISIQRGIDPRSFTLASFGGAGGLHVCALAEALGLQQALVPVHGGVLSALGMLVARPGRQLSRTLLRDMAIVEPEEVERVMYELANQGCAALRNEGVLQSDIEQKFSADLRYKGQSYALNLPWQPIEQLIEQFHKAHLQRYGHRMNLPVELVTVRVAVAGPEPVIDLLENAETVPGQAFAHTGVTGCSSAVPCFTRQSLSVNQTLLGPAVIVEQVSTTWLAPGWQACVDRVGNLQLTCKNTRK